MRRPFRSRRLIDPPLLPSRAPSPVRTSSLDSPPCNCTPSRRSLLPSRSSGRSGSLSTRRACPQLLDRQRIERVVDRVARDGVAAPRNGISGWYLLVGTDIEGAATRIRFERDCIIGCVDCIAVATIFPYDDHELRRD